MLNIRRLSPGAADYYLGEVATAAEDYYTGHVEAAGRWAGSLAATIGLSGEVRSEHFRAVLDDRHPFTGERLVSRDSPHAHPDGRSQPQLFDSNRLEVTRAASRLRLTVGPIRQLLWAGQRPQASRPRNYLTGALVPRRRGRALRGRAVSSEGEGSRAR